MTRRRITEEDQIQQKEYQAALSERHITEETLRMREMDYLERLKTLKRKKEEFRKQQEEEERIRMEAKRRIEKEERAKEEEEKKKKEEQRQRIQALYQRARDAFEAKQYDQALQNLSELFVYESAHQEGLVLQEKVKAAQEIEAKGTFEEVQTEEVPSPPKEVRPKKPFPTKLVLIAFLAVAVIIGGYFVITLVGKSLLRGEIRVVVLPLKGATADESTIGAGLAEEIIEKLHYVDALTVMGYSSSAFVNEKYADPLLASVRLGYPYVVRGTLSRAGGSYSIEVHLVDSVGASVWSQSYQTSADQLAGLAGEIARQIVNHFNVTIQAEVASALSHTSTTHGEAYNSYLTARELMHHPTGTNLRSAVQLLQRAQQQDENFAETFAASSLAYSMMYDRSIDRTESALQSAEEFTMKATMARGTLPLVLLAKGRVALLKGRLNDAMEDFEHCLQLTPLHSEAIKGKAEIMIRTGRYDEAQKLLEKAYNLNPRDEDILRNLAFVCHLNGRTKEGMRYHELNLSVVADSVAYLIGPIADAIPYDPDVLEAYKERVKNAFDMYLRQHGKDLAVSYRGARHLQFIVSPEALNALKAVENDLRRELATRPTNVDAMLYLALTVTRSGAFKEGNSLVDKVKSLHSDKPAVLYKIAEVYSIQKKNDVYDVVKSAVTKDFYLDEIVNGDFYNVKEDEQFKKAIILPMR